MDAGEITVVLAGISGAGKSTLFQNLLGEEVDILISAKPITQRAKQTCTQKNGKKIYFIDTPSLTGTEDENKETLKKWSKEIKNVDLLVVLEMEL